MTQAPALESLGAGGGRVELAMWWSMILFDPFLVELPFRTSSRVADCMDHMSIGQVHRALPILLLLLASSFPKRCCTSERHAIHQVIVIRRTPVSTKVTPHLPI